MKEISLGGKNNQKRLRQQCHLGGYLKIYISGETIIHNTIEPESTDKVTQDI